jgi:hypothetical protein
MGDQVMLLSEALVKGASPGFELSGLHTFTATAVSARYGLTVSVSGVNVTAGLTQLVSFDVPAGSKMIILGAAFTGTSGGTAPTVIEVEVDGSTVLRASAASVAANPRIVGYDADVAQGGAQQIMVRDIVVTSNIKVRASCSLWNAAGLTINYILVK